MAHPAGARAVAVHLANDGPELSGQHFQPMFWTEKCSDFFFFLTAARRRDRQGTHSHSFIPGTLVMELRHRPLLVESRFIKWLDEPARQRI